MQSPPLPNHRIVFRGRLFRSSSILPLPHSYTLVPIACGGGGDGGVQVKQRKYLVKMKEDPKQVASACALHRVVWGCWLFGVVGCLIWGLGHAF